MPNFIHLQFLIIGMLKHAIRLIMKKLGPEEYTSHSD